MLGALSPPMGVLLPGRFKTIVTLSLGGSEPRVDGGELHLGCFLSTGGLGSFWALPLRSGELRLFPGKSMSAQKGILP